MEGLLLVTRIPREQQEKPDSGSSPPLGVLDIEQQRF
jgi:hypothetical protein